VQTTTPTVTAPAVKLPDAGSFFHSFAPFWPVFLLFGLVLLLRVVQVVREGQRLRRSGIAEIDRMSGTTFERRLAVLFRGLGYRVEMTGRSGGDYGCDLVLKQGGRRVAVQAKCWAKNVGIKAVQEAAASRLHYQADSAMVVTNRYFSRPARELAQSNHVELWDRDRLVRELVAFSERQTGKTARSTETVGAEAPVSVAENRTTAPALRPEQSCARCGQAVSQRVLEFCLAHPKRFGGRVYCFAHQRSFPADP
jgi:restriction system protein